VRPKAKVNIDRGRYIRRPISRKPFETEAWSQRKLHMGYWMSSRDLKGAVLVVTGPMLSLVHTPGQYNWFYPRFVCDS